MEQDKIIEQVKRYKLGQFLAGNNSTKFHKCIAVETQTPYAAKVLVKEHNSKEDQVERINNEIQVHRTLMHPNVVNLMEHFEDEQNTYILYEFCEKNNLRNYIKKFGKMKEDLAKSVSFQLLQAIKFIHNHNIIHRDIKLSNILLSGDNVVKLGNFSLAKQLGSAEGRTNEICGSRDCVAPEIINQSEEGYGFSVDIWGFGTTLFGLVYGKPPFEAKTQEEEYEKIKTGDFQFPESVEVSEELKDLIAQTLTINPDERITLERIENHEFYYDVEERIEGDMLKDPSGFPGVKMKFRSLKDSA